MTRTEEKVFWNKISNKMAKIVQEELKASKIQWKDNYFDFIASGMDFELILRRKEKI